jgi:hypothetical protein
VRAWPLLNETPLPVVCFTRPGHRDHRFVCDFGSELNALGDRKASLNPRWPG